MSARSQRFSVAHKPVVSGREGKGECELDVIFRPRSVAVVGASGRRGGLGREILENLLAMPFNGKVFPVNPRVEVIHCIKCYPKVSDIPDEVDLAVIVVPRQYVLDVVDD